MGPIFKGLRALVSNAWARWFVLPAGAIVAIGWVVSATPPPPTVDLAAEPLYARGARAKPTLTLALSVEFPTVGAQYVKTPGATEDDSYAPTKEYVGYFDPESCYTYNATPTETRPSGVPIEDYRRFDRSGDAARDGSGNSLRTCGGTAFSGNFMNWASSSAIDILRYGLTGGDRVVDTTSLTVLQRAYLPTTTPNNYTNFWNQTNFPAKRLLSSYVNGAVPTSLKGTHTGDIYVANCRNRIHFGTQATGSCATPGNNSNLGTTGTTTAVTDYSGTLPTGFSSTPCAVEDALCSFAGTKEVAYGYGTSWKRKTVSGGTPCDNTTFGDPFVGQVKACYTRDVSATTQLTPDGFFYSRVSVCGSSGGTLNDRRTALCRRYDSGYFKPVGNLQKYSDVVRVAAFGYLNENSDTNQRQGGVLRAPMKYVGPKSFDANFSLVSGTNPVQEWNPQTGVFTLNPDSASEGISGVSNYVNRFGRTGATLGLYKRRDPISELYYESLRYIQGLPPTTAAISPIDTTMKDGYPAYTTWTDPHPAVAGMTDYSCVKNNILAIGDVNANQDRYIPGNPTASTNDPVRAANLAGNEPNFYEWTKVVGAFESNRAVNYVDGKGVTRTTSNPNTPTASLWGMETQNVVGTSTAWYYMAGAAYWANTHDIRGTGWSDTAKRRPGMRLRTYMVDVNEFGNQSDQATRRKNQYFLAGKYGGFKDVTGTGNPFQSYVSGTTTLVNSNENWERGSTGEAKNYFLSSSAKDLLAALDDIFANIAEEANSIAGGAISTQRLTTSDNFIYQAQFDPAEWSGDLVAYPVSANASGVVTVGSSASSPWRNLANQPVGAAGKLADKAPNDRNIVVGGNPTDVAGTYSAASFNATVFNWASLDTVNKEALRAPPYAASGTPLDAESMGEARLDFLRGVRTNEAGGSGTNAFRKRGAVLGDIVNSGVVFSGAPVQRYADQSSFVSLNADRKKALFVGANDGMLHAFDSATGAELFAYIPRFLVSKLPALTSPNYAHRSYADGSPVVAEAKVGNDWKTVLVAGAGGGGQGVFALDVSRPETFAAGNVMWEFTDRDDPAMGNVIGRPQILKFRRSAPGSPPDYRHYAVVASGVNNQLADGHAADGAPAIFLLDLSKAANEDWSEGDNYYKVSFPIASDATTIASGMSGFTARLGFADEVTTLYAGDLHGNVWKLDFSKFGEDEWDMSHLSFFKGDSDAVIPMYVAKDSSGNRQPITMDPTLVFGPNRSIIVSFGTGKFLESSDNAGPYKTQSVYALLDNHSAKPDTSSGATAAISGRARLKAGTVTDHVISVAPFEWGRPTVDDDATTRSGWHFDFPGSGGSGTDPGTGERQISSFGVLAGKLIFGSVIPALNSCDNGSGNLYVVDLKTGDGSSETSVVGILGEPFITQVGASTLTGSDTTGRRKETTRYQPILQGSGGLAVPSGLAQIVAGNVGRLSWREISNYQDLRNAP